MRKYVVGAIFGALLTLAISASAAEINSMIGKKVDDTLPLEISGKRAEKDVIVIEGTSYLPVKVAGELFGYIVSYDESTSTVQLAPKEGAISVDKQAQKDKLDKEKAEQLARDKAREEQVKRDIIKRKEDQIKAREYKLNTFKEMEHDNRLIYGDQGYEEKVKELQAQVDKCQAELDALNKDLADFLAGATK